MLCGHNHLIPGGATIPKERLPFIKLFVGDWLKDDISACSLAAQGLWIRMMFIMNESPRYGYLLTASGKPMPDDMVARRCGCSLDEFLKLFTELTSVGIPSTNADGVVFSRRMINDSKTSKIRAKAGSLGGRSTVSKYWREFLPKQKRKFAVANGKANTDYDYDYDKVVKDVVVVNNSSSNGNAKSYKINTPMQKLVAAWKELNGFQFDDRDWDKLNYGRASKGLAPILEVFGGDHVRAIDCLQDIVTDLKKKGLDYSLEKAVTVRVMDWRAKHGTHSK